MTVLRSTVTAATLLLLSASPALAGDGQSEINQTCAVQTGCFAGDTAGFPVTITAPGSYRLTGGLDLTGQPSALDAVLIQSSYVVLDLSGFGIIGSNSCSGVGSALSCTFNAGGSGVFIEDPSFGITVTNGVIRNMPGWGVVADGQGHRVERVTARHNGGDGIGLSPHSMVLASIAIENGSDGIDVDHASVVENCVTRGNGDDGIEGDGDGVVVRASTARDNGGAGFDLSLATYSTYSNNQSTNNTAADSCGGGICTDKKRYYLARGGGYDGDEAPTACAPGFHMASLPELQNPAALEYDTELGLLAADSPDGPSPSLGYIRSMRIGSATGSGAAFGNCALWTSSSGSHTGTAAQVVPYGLATATAAVPGAWEILGVGCDGGITGMSVWCVEE